MIKNKFTVKHFLCVKIIGQRAFCPQTAESRLSGFVDIVLTIACTVQGKVDEYNCHQCVYLSWT